MRLPAKLGLLASIVLMLLIETLDNKNFKFRVDAMDITILEEHHKNLQNTSSNEYMNDPSSDDVRILREICPANFCTYNGTDEYALDVTEQNKVCCIPCDCSDECFDLGNCCYGKDQSNKRPRDEESELCTQTFISNSEVRPVSVRLSFMLYQHCNESENADLAHKCRAKSEVDLGEYIPVYSPYTGRHYRNKYCAICNQDHGNLTDWIQELRCFDHTGMLNLLNDESFPSMSIIHRLKNGTTTCSLYFKPPDGINATKCIHPRNIISTCHSFSQSYGQYDKKCRTFHAPVIHGGVEYKNVFCLMCNDPVVYFEDTGCFANETTNSFVAIPPFMALLTSRETGVLNLMDKNSTDSNICNSPAVINEEINACITIRCPLTMLRAGNRCYKAFSTLATVILDFRVDVTHPVFDEYDDFKLYNEMMSILHYIDYAVLEISITNREFVGENIHAKAQMQIIVFDEIDLGDAFKSFANNINDYNKNTSNIWKMKVGNGPIAIPPIGNSLALPSYKDKITPAQAIAMSEIIFCPLVVLNEYTKLSDDTIRVDSMIFKEGEFVRISGSGEKPSIYVCMKSYIQQYKKSRKAPQVGTSGYERQFSENLYLVCLNIFALAFTKYYK